MAGVEEIPRVKLTSPRSDTTQSPLEKQWALGLGGIMSTGNPITQTILGLEQHFRPVHQQLYDICQKLMEKFPKIKRFQIYVTIDDSSNDYCYIDNQDEEYVEEVICLFNKLNLLNYKDQKMCEEILEKLNEITSVQSFGSIAKMVFTSFIKDLGNRVDFNLVIERNSNEIRIEDANNEKVLHTIQLGEES